MAIELNGEFDCPGAEAMTALTGVMDGSRLSDTYMVVSRGSVNRGVEGVKVKVAIIITNCLKRRSNGTCGHNSFGHDCPFV
jgi:hypothetical protein